MNALFQPRLRPYLQTAAKGDWHDALRHQIQNTPAGELIRLKQESEAELKQLGFFREGSQTHFIHIYLCRVIAMCKRELSFPFH